MNHGLTLTDYKALKGVKILSINIRSLFNKWDSFDLELLDNCIDIIGRSETWLDANIPNSLTYSKYYQT